MIFRTTWTSLLLSRNAEWCKDQFGKRFRNVKIRRSCSRGLPCGIKSRFGSPFDAVKIYLPGSFRIKALDQAFHGQSKLRDPSLAGFVQSNAAPQTTLQVVLLAWRDVQIDPKSVRADFEFFITTEMRWVGLKENFRDVAVPELVAAAIGLGIGKNGDGAIFRVESHKKRLRSPE